MSFSRAAQVERFTELWRVLDGLPHGAQRDAALAAFFAIANDDKLPPLRVGIELTHEAVSA